VTARTLLTTLREWLQWPLQKDKCPRDFLSRASKLVAVGHPGRSTRVRLNTRAPALGRP
jgi:hypothetical protein